MVAAGLQEALQPALEAGGPGPPLAQGEDAGRVVACAVQQLVEAAGARLLAAAVRQGLRGRPGRQQRGRQHQQQQQRHDGPGDLGRQEARRWGSSRPARLRPLRPGPAQLAPRPLPACAPTSRFASFRAAAQCCLCRGAPLWLLYLLKPQHSISSRKPFEAPHGKVNPSFLGTLSPSYPHESAHHST